MHRSLRFLVFVGSLLGAGGASRAAETTAAAIPGSVPTVEVDSFQIRYGREHPKLPDVATLAAISVPLVQNDGVWTAGSGGSGALALGTVPAGSRFDGAALRQVAEEIVKHFNTRGIFGVWVVFEGIETVAAGKAEDGAKPALIDSRAPSDHTAKLVVWASEIAELRTLARGTRFKASLATNNRKHAWIASHSPLRAGGPDQPSSLLSRDLLEDYLHQLNSYGGRRVEASVASAGEPGQIVLDYLVTEATPWQVFGQVSNTGTKSTDEWRGRLGFQDSQLTNHDDLFNLDFITTPDFGTVAGFVSYRLPLGRASRFSTRVYGSYGDFSADGQSLANLRFTGNNWLVGAELIYRRELWRRWGLTLNAGTNYAHYTVDTNVGATSISKGQSAFLVPFVGAIVAREDEKWGAEGSLRFEHSVDSVADKDPTTGAGSLGRSGATTQWTLLRWSLSYHMYLESLFARGQTPRTLAHDVSLRTRGRFLLQGERLIPQEQDLLGGASSVRGYPESVVAADQSVVVTGEYAFHVPLALRPGDAGRFLGRSFRWRPPQPLLRPDWDLIFRLFADYGYRGVGKAPLPVGAVVQVGDVPLSERNLSIYSAGGGVELVLWQNLSLRCDVGMALKSIKDPDQTLAKYGDLRAHVAASLFW